MSTQQVDPRSAKWWRGIGPGDTVWYSDRGDIYQGKVVIARPTHVVLNTGGRHGTPKVVNENNYQQHKACRRI